MTRFSDVLKNKNFFFLWLGQLISNFGDRLNQMALVALIYMKNPGSEIALAKLISFTIIPVFLIGPIAGAWVDRLNRKNIMIISDVSRGVLVLLIPLFIILNQILPIYLVIFIVFSISRFFIPSKMAIIPELVSKEKLLVANTLQDTTHTIGNVAGLVAAGILVNMRHVGAIGGFYIDSLTFFVSAILIAMITHDKSSKDMKEELAVTRDAIKDSFRRSIFHEIKEGFNYLARYSNMRFVMFVFFLLMAWLGAISCVIIVFVQQAFSTSTRDLGFLGMFLAGGLFLGTIFYGRLAQKVRKKKAIYISFIAAGILIILFAIFLSMRPSLIIAGMLSAAIGISVSPIMVSTNTLTHEMIPEEIRGRIFSSLEAVIHLAFLVFMFIAAYAAKYVDRFWIIVATGAVFSICGMAGVFSKAKGGTTSP